MKDKRAEKTPAQKTPVAANTSPTQESKIFQTLLPHLIAVVIFVVVNLLYFSPMVTGNKMIQQSDILHYKGTSKELKDFREQTGKEALWTNCMFGGMPAFQISVFYHGNLLRYIDKGIGLWFPHPSELLIIAFLCFYILLVVMKVNPWLAIAGALAYGLSSYNLILLEAGHTTKMHAIGLWPLVVAGILLLRQEKYGWGTILTVVGLSLQIYANHLQITYYLILLLLTYAIVELIYAIMEKKYKNLLIMGGIVIACGGLAVVSNLSMLWSTFDYLPSTIRGPSELSSNKQSTGGLDKDYAMGWSYGKMETFTLLIPDFQGGSSHAKLGEDSHFAALLKQYGQPAAQIKQYLESAPMYWGDQPFTSGPVYVGAIICFLFLLAMMVIKERWKWWLLSACILAVMLAWGKNLMWFSDFFFYHMPGYNRFRVVAMILVIVQFAFPFLGFIMLSKIVKGEYDKDYLISRLKLSVYITGGLCLFFALLGSSFFNFKGPEDAKMQPEVLDALVADRKSLLRMDAFRSLVFILLAAGLIWAYLKERVKINLFMGGIALLVFIDLFTVGKRYLDSSDFISKNEYDQYFKSSQIDQLILKETSKDYRVLNLAGNTFNDSHTSYFHKSVGGYHAAKLRRYQEIIENQLTHGDTTKKSPYPFNKQVIDMLNTKYIIFKAGNNDQVAPNTEALDNAWFVNDVRMVENADEEMKALNDFNPANTVIVDKRYAQQLQGFTPNIDSSANILLTSYAPNDLKYKSKSSVEAVAVFSEIYYQPGWDAFVDGKKSDHFRCNYILRGMRLPAGEHDIEFKFEPESFYTGEKIAMAGSGIVWLLLIGVVLREVMLRRKEGVTF